MQRNSYKCTKKVIRINKSYKLCKMGLIGLLGIMTSTGCTPEETKNIKQGENKEAKLMVQNKIFGGKDYEALFKDIVLSPAFKDIGNYNPLITQRFGADPYVIVYEDKVYVYMTGDTLEYDDKGEVKPNSYGKINTLNVISSEDLVNWTDHGCIYAAGPTGASKWGNNSWAPAVAYKEVDGKMKFFVYFANSGNGIGVLTADSPIGPFTDPLNKPLISRATPNCGNVEWLFDPAVFVDEDNEAYIYFGGGVPEGKEANPGTGRVAKLGQDMISLEGKAITLEAPYLFEDSGINKIGDTYYYSYCSNFSVSPEDSKTLGFGEGEIIYMTSKSPMGPFKMQGSILKNPGYFFGCYGNNHHCMFSFKDKWYIAYHTQMLEQKMGLSQGYRSTNIDEVQVNADGSIQPIQATKKGVQPIKCLNPYNQVEAETMVNRSGISTKPSGKISEEYGTGNQIVCEMHTGDWLQVSQVNFEDIGAKTFTAAIKSSKGQDGVIQIRLDSLEGEVIGYLDIEGDEKRHREQTTKLWKEVTGIHELFFIFYGEGYSLDYWYMSK